MIPWHESEFVRYRGYALVYTQTGNSEMIVHLPGRISRPVSMLDQSALQVPAKSRQRQTRRMGNGSYD